MIKSQRINTCLAFAVATSLALPNATLADHFEETLVTGRSMESSIALDLSHYGYRLEIITDETLERQGFADVSQALQMLVPGLHIAPKSGPFDYVSASLQGSRSTEILWLIDGVRITNRLYNGTSPLDTLPAHMIERIEILKGGQGIFYGTQSVGGVINIITKSPTAGPTQGTLGMGAHSNEGFNIHGDVSTQLGDHQFLAYASKDAANGYQPWHDADIQPSATDRRRGYDVNMFGAKYAWAVNSTSRFSAQYQRTQNELDSLSPFRTAETVNERVEDILTAKYETNVSDNIGLYIKAYYHQWDTHYTRIENQLDDDGHMTGERTVINDHDYWGYTDYGVNAMAEFDFDRRFAYTLGFDHQRYSGEDDVWKIADQNETVNAGFFQVRTTERFLANTSLAFGARHNRTSNTDSSTVWSLSGQHNFSEHLYLRGSVGTSFRLPDAEQLFLNEYYDTDNDGVPDDGWFAIGNPELKPERSRNINIGLGGRWAGITYELVGFDREITDYIASYVPLTINGVVGESFANTDDVVKVRGGEIIANRKLTRNWHADFSYTHTRSELNGDGHQLTGIPEDEAKLGLRYEPAGANYGGNLSINYVGDVTGRSGTHAGNYTVMDVSAFYEFGIRNQHQLVLRLENPTDREYATSYGVATRDTGGTYLYRNLGMTRTLHLNYSYRF